MSACQKSGDYNDIYTFTVLQGFWGSINLNLGGKKNCLKFRLFDNKQGTPMMTMIMCLNNGGTEKVITFPAETISQVLFTDIPESTVLPTTIVLRLTMESFQIMKSELPDNMENWRKLMDEGHTHSKSFSDNLIFVVHPAIISFKETGEDVIDSTWEKAIKEYTNDIFAHWRDYYQYTLKYSDDSISDIIEHLELRDFKVFYEEFGLISVNLKNEYDDSVLIGFQSVPLDMTLKYGDAYKQSKVVIRKVVIEDVKGEEDSEDEEMEESDNDTMEDYDSGAEMEVEEEVSDGDEDDFDEDIKDDVEEDKSSDEEETEEDSEDEMDYY